MGHSGRCWMSPPLPVASSGWQIPAPPAASPSAGGGACRGPPSTCEGVSAGRPRRFTQPFHCSSHPRAPYGRNKKNTAYRRAEFAAYRASAAKNVTGLKCAKFCRVYRIPQVVGPNSSSRGCVARSWCPCLKPPSLMTLAPCLSCQLRLLHLALIDGSRPHSDAAWVVFMLCTDVVR